MYVDRGNDVAALIKAFKEVKDSTKPVVVHINTLKGKGYAPAEIHKEQWHYSGPFDIETGKPLFDNVEEDYSSVTCEYLLEKMKNDSSVVAITSGTPTVMGFTEDKRKEAGSQFVDVGIAEETAVALASGVAVNGGKPFYGVYSSFVQRTFDQVSQDVCINNSPITMVIYQGSVYGMNDVTHLGFQDIPMLSNIPNLVYLAPATKEEYLAMLDWSMEQTSYPVAIKLPGGPMISDGSRVTKNFGRLNRYEVAQTGEKIAIIGLGTFFELAKEAAKLLKALPPAPAPRLRVMKTSPAAEVTDSAEGSYCVTHTCQLQTTLSWASKAAINAFPSINSPFLSAATKNETRPSSSVRFSIICDVCQRFR